MQALFQVQNSFGKGARVLFRLFVDYHLVFLWEENVAVSIVLDMDKCLARGGKKLIFKHPDNDDLLIKVLIPEKRAKWIAEKKIRLIKRRFGAYYRTFYREIDEYLSVSMRSDRIPDFIQPFYGICHTNLGIGMIVGKILGPEGQLAQTLEKIATTGQFSAKQLHDLVDVIFDKLVANRVVACDLVPCNFVLDLAEGSPRLVLIDGFGDTTLIPIKKHIFWPLKRSLAKKRAALHIWIEKHAVKD